MNTEVWNPVTAEQRSLPPAGFVYPENYVPADLDDWYPVHTDTGDPLPTALSGHRRLGGEYIAQTPPELRHAHSAAAQDSIVPKGFKATIEKPLPVIRCIQIKEDGERCGRWSRRGGTKCIIHENKRSKAMAAEKVQQARLRLVGMADDAIDVLHDLIAVGTNDAIRLKAATEILDRANIKGSTDINIEVEHKVDAGAELRQRLEKMRQNSAIDVGEIVIVDEPGGENDD